jgi:hypothetical protein
MDEARLLAHAHEAPRADDGRDDHASQTAAQQRTQIVSEGGDKSGATGSLSRFSGLLRAFGCSS